MRILILGAGVIGSVYAGQLLQAGHDVALVARGKRLRDLRAHRLVERNAESSEHLELAIEVLDAPARDARYDLVVVAVRCEQLSGTLPILAAKTHVRDVLFFGNTAGHARGLIEGLGDRALFGFDRRPAASCTVRRLQAVFTDAGFPTRLTADIDGWLLGHAAFVVPIAFALYRADTDAARLARDTVTLRLMVRAAAQAFRALRTRCTSPRSRPIWPSSTSGCRESSRSATGNASWRARAANCGSPATPGARLRR